VIDLAVDGLIGFACGLLSAGLVVLVVLSLHLVGDLHLARVRKHNDRIRHVRTLEQELGLEPYPLGPLDAPDVPTASPVRHDTAERERAERIEAMVALWRQNGR
jgi:hypothetical protein